MDEGRLESKVALWEGGRVLLHVDVASLDRGPVCREPVPGTGRHLGVGVGVLPDGCRLCVADAAQFAFARAVSEAGIHEHR